MNQQDRRPNVGGGGKTDPVTDDKATPADLIVKLNNCRPLARHQLVDLAQEAADALAAVTAERDVVMLLAHRYANQATNAETERDQARQILADAPHASPCASLWRYPDHHVEPCGCWKAGL